MINFTEKAGKEVERLLGKNYIEKSYVRIGMKAGGCSGFDVQMDLETEGPKKHDLTFESNCVNIVIDKKSHLYLKDMVVDFIREGLTEGFKFNPPNATAMCGCGTSFAFSNLTDTKVNIPKLNF